MIRTILFTLICIFSLMFCACVKPIEFDPPIPPRGFYNGTFQIGFYPKNDSSYTLLQNIEWTFSDQKFWCQIDTLNLLDSDIICDFYGSYLLENNIVFSNVVMESSECDSNLTARDSFEISRIYYQDGIDSIMFYQHFEDSTEVIEKTIRLVRE